MREKAAYILGNRLKYLSMEKEFRGGFIFGIMKQRAQKKLTMKLSLGEGEFNPCKTLSVFYMMVYKDRNRIFINTAQRRKYWQDLAEICRI